MEKIISLFKRDYKGTRLVYDEIVPGAEWVIAGEGLATRKWDGTCCMIRDGKLYKRYEVKKGKKPPADFEAVTDIDPITGKQQGWLPVGKGPEDQYHREAFDEFIKIVIDHGYELIDIEDTYELIGPKIQGNPEHEDEHILLRHGSVLELNAPRDFEGLKDYLSHHDIEGVVWHHPDGRMVKIKGKDFGIKRPVESHS